MCDVGGGCLLNLRISYQIIVPRGTIRITDGSRKQHGRRCVGKRTKLRRLKPFCSILAGFSDAILGLIVYFGVKVYTV